VNAWTGLRLSDARRQLVGVKSQIDRSIQAEDDDNWLRDAPQDPEAYVLLNEIVGLVNTLDQKLLDLVLRKDHDAVPEEEASQEGSVAHIIDPTSPSAEELWGQ
jgi:hypothetical protein